LHIFYCQLEDSFVQKQCKQEVDEFKMEQEEEEDDEKHAEQERTADEDESTPPQKKLRIAAFAIAPSECIIKAENSDQRLTAVEVPGGLDVKLFSDSLEMSCLVRCRICSKIITWDSFARHAEKAHKDWYGF
jgi:hypothetical protein